MISPHPLLPCKGFAPHPCVLLLNLLHFMPRSVSVSCETEVEEEEEDEEEEEELWVLLSGCSQTKFLLSSVCLLCTDICCVLERT